MEKFFRLWAAIRRTATTEHIVGEDTLDMVPYTLDRTCPFLGKVPLPPVLIQQLDIVLILGILNPLRREVLTDFQKIVVANKPKSWMTIYLITFMLLHSCATLSAENYENASKHGFNRRYAMPAFIKELHHGATVLLCYYHYCTKPCDPFSLDWKRRYNTPFKDLPPDDVLFILETKDMVRGITDKLRRIREHALYENDLFFLSQMFDEDWQPINTVVNFDDGTVENVPLKKYFQ